MISKLQDFYSWYIASGLHGTELPIPVVETFLVFGILTICLLFRFSRVGLIVAYVFVYRWGWTVRHLIFSEDILSYNRFVIAYIVFGILVLTFTIIGMVRSER